MLRASAILDRLNAARGAGPAATTALLRRRAWSATRSLGLVCEPSRVPPPRPAKVPVRMERGDTLAIDAFEEELGRVEGDDHLEVRWRIAMCRAAVRQLYVARDEHGVWMYVQWLVSPDDQEALHRYTNEFPRLADRDWLVEGAYTFVRFRRLGIMGEGMHQLTERAREGGAQQVSTYVAADNVGSLRGCANAGFGLAHVRTRVHRLGAERILWRPPDERAQHEWAAATAR